MTVAFDKITTSGYGTTERSWSHDPVGTPRGVLVFVLGHFTGADQVTGVTYDGDALTELTSSPNQKAAAEAMTVHCYFRGADVGTTDPATVTVAQDDTGGKFGICLTFTANTDLEIVDTDTVNSGSVENPEVTLSLNGRTSYCAVSGISGQGAVTGIAPRTGSLQTIEYAIAALQCGFLYPNTTLGNTDFTTGVTQTAEDAVYIATAISEILSAPPLRSPLRPYLHNLGR